MNLIPIEKRTMLCYLSVGGWSARKLDRKASKEVVDTNGASADAARVNKNLLASADQSLAAIRKKGDDARKYIDSNTLPWDDAGNRLLPNAKAVEVIGQITAYEQEYNALVDAFVLEYPVLRAQAIAALGDLANNDDYPQPDVVRQKFYFRISMTPMPAGFGEDRLGLNEDQCKALQAHYAARAQEQFNRALKSAWTRLRENVTHIHERLTPSATDPDKTKIFRDSMLENTRETCALLKDLNVFNDLALEAARRDVEQCMASVDADTLRKSPAVATAVRDVMDDVLQRMAAWV